MSPLFEILFTILLLILVIGCLGFFLSVYLLIERVVNLPEAAKRVFLPQTAVDGLDERTIETTVPVESFTPDPRKPLKVKYEDEDVITDEDNG